MHADRANTTLQRAIVKTLHWKSSSESPLLTEFNCIEMQWGLTYLRGGFCESVVTVYKVSKPYLMKKLHGMTDQHGQPFEKKFRETFWHFYIH